MEKSAGQKISEKKLREVEKVWNNLGSDLSNTRNIESEGMTILYKWEFKKTMKKYQKCNLDVDFVYVVVWRIRLEIFVYF